MMKLILLAFIAIASASFCIDGSFSYSYKTIDSNCAVSTMTSYNINTTTMVKVLDRGFTSYRRIDELVLGDMVDSGNGYSAITLINSCEIMPQIIIGNTYQAQPLLSTGSCVEWNPSTYLANAVMTDGIIVAENYTSIMNYKSDYDGKTFSFDFFNSEYKAMQYLNASSISQSAINARAVSSGHCGEIYSASICTYGVNVFNYVPMLEFLQANNYLYSGNYIDYTVDIPMCKAIDLRTESGSIGINGLTVLLADSAFSSMY